MDCPTCTDQSCEDCKIEKINKELREGEENEPS